MSPESTARLHAVQISRDASVVEGPLQGYHHETYVFPLHGEAGRLRPGRWKCREPRADLLWFDRRCFVSEEQLLKALRGRVKGIPEIVDIDGTGLQRFIEGQTLGSFCKSGAPVPEVFRHQILELFRQLAAVAPAMIKVSRRCEAEDRPDDGDTEAFLERLVLFTEQHVYQHNLDRFGRLFLELGLDGDAFRHLRKHVAGLRQRPFCLLHADLHRENFIVDAERRLWTIDWELAMVGDPLYDLATHLHLMRYPARQAHSMAEQWCAAVEESRPGSSNGWRQDLRRLIDYKKAQSVFTDVIRTALTLGAVQRTGRRRLASAVLKLGRILADAAVPLGLETVPEPRTIVTALVRWHERHGHGRPER